MNQTNSNQTETVATETPSGVSVLAFMHPLKYHLFRGLWLATLVANIGTWMQSAGAAWMMTTLVKSPGMIALVQTATTLPMLLFVIPAGVIADRINRPKFLLFVQTFAAITALVLGLLDIFKLVTPWMLLIFTFLLGAATAIRMPAWQAAASELVPHAELPAATSINNLNFNIGRSLGPAIAGLLIAYCGFAVIFLLNAISLLGTIYFFFEWQKKSRIEYEVKENFWVALQDGINAAFKSSAFKLILIRTGLLYFGTTALWALLPIVAKEQLLCQSSGFGLLMGCLGIGAISAAFMLPHLRYKMKPYQLINVATIAFAMTQTMLGYTKYFPLACIELLVSGCAWAIILSTLNAAAQGAFPLSMRARAISVYLVIFYGGVALGSVIWGKVADYLSVTSSLSIASLCLVIGLILTIKHRF